MIVIVGEALMGSRKESKAVLAEEEAKKNDDCIVDKDFWFSLASLESDRTSLREIIMIISINFQRGL
jgi:hypothetical protein